MRATIASGIGSLLAVMVSHSGRCTTSRADALRHFSTRIQTGLRTDSGEERNFLKAIRERVPNVSGNAILTP